MRTEKDMLDLILKVAELDDRIRAVMLNGSRVNPKIAPDSFQDYDVIYWVKDPRAFEDDPSWVDQFGERIIMQMPHLMRLDEIEDDHDEDRITYLVLLKDFNRIDLSLLAVKNRASYQDSLSRILLDKDGLFNSWKEPSDRDYWIKKPSQERFDDCCNEFWWVSTYVVKGLCRNQILYAREILENPVRRMFVKMLEWYVGTERGFSLNLGTGHRFLSDYLDHKMRKRLMKTYSDGDKQNITNSLMEMIAQFDEVGLIVSKKLGLGYNTHEAIAVKDYIQTRLEEFKEK